MNAGVQSTTMERHLVVGSGAVGSRVARILADAGHSVVLVSRSGSGPVAPGIERVAADAADAEGVAALARGAAAIYNCANPAYHRWPTDWPPIAAALLAAAERSRAVLCTVSNLYGYGPASASLGVPAYERSHPMTEATPLAAPSVKAQVRVRMWQDALALHEAGRIRATEIRSSDYIGRGAQSAVGDRIVGPLLAGRPIFVPGRADRLHTWTFLDDVARMAVLAARDPRAWGRAWHTPSNEPRTIRQVVDDLAARAGVRAPRIVTMPSPAFHALGYVSTLMRELRTTEYQFRFEFVMDSSLAQGTFGMTPTPWDSVLDDVLEARDSTAASAPAA